MAKVFRSQRFGILDDDTKAFWQSWLQFTRKSDEFTLRIEAPTCRIKVKVSAKQPMAAYAETAFQYATEESASLITDMTVEVSPSTVVVGGVELNGLYAKFIIGTVEFTCSLDKYLDRVVNNTVTLNASEVEAVYWRQMNKGWQVLCQLIMLEANLPDD